MPGMAFIQIDKSGGWFFYLRRALCNNTPVTIGANTNLPGKPSFRNTLSAGDRNTLALALFFSSVYESPNLADMIVVLDDPMSSLDDHCSITTVQEIRKLSQKAGQVIVLSHNKRFLCNIWDHAYKSTSVALEIRGSREGSILVGWNVSEDSLTEHDRRHGILQAYYDAWNGEEREVAGAIRLHLESFLRVACPRDFRPGDSLGRGFLDRCRQKLNVGTPILEVWPRSPCSEEGLWW